jgi:GNAT superfamily N-acetyltransferase
VRRNFYLVIMVIMVDASRPWTVRSYREEDQSAVDGLLDASSDPLWVAQGHRLHGQARDGERWRRTLVAERSGEVVGAVTIARNLVHPGRYNLAVEVAATSRGRGVGFTLIEQARRLAPEPKPLAAKLRPADTAGVALLRRVGGRIYQRCPGLCPDPTSPQVLAWAARTVPASDAVVLPLTQLPRATWPELWVRQYLWVHDDWSPAAEEPLRELARDLIAEVDPELSTITLRGASVEAVTWVFDLHGSTVEVVAETTQRHTPNGVSNVAAGLARSLSQLNERGIRKAEIDGHVSDPHLAPALDTLPNVPREPLYLVEVDPTAAAQ